MQALFNRLLVIVISPVLAGAAANLQAQTFSTLYAFTILSDYSFTNIDGYEPSAPLCLSSNMLYGTTVGGGAASGGSVFKVGIDGSGFANLHSFTAYPIGTNSD